MTHLKRLFLTACFFLTLHFGFAQKDHLSSKQGEVSAGIGLGLPYGGIGGRLGLNIIDELNAFIGVGYQFAGTGYNLGLRKDFASSAMTQFYLTGMYGTNAAIRVVGLPEVDELYTGVSVGAGIKINSRKTKGNHWDLGILVPFLSSDYKDDEAALKANPLIREFDESPLPILFVIGYNFNL